MLHEKLLIFSKEPINFEFDTIDNPIESDLIALIEENKRQKLINLLRLLLVLYSVKVHVILEIGLDYRS